MDNINDELYKLEEQLKDLKNKKIELIQSQDNRPFNIRIKEDLDRLKKIELIQQEAMAYIIKKYFPNEKNDILLHFAEFWRGFLDGDYNSIIDYLKQEGLQIEDPKERLKHEMLSQITKHILNNDY